jgi:hypothetical protein
MCRLEGALTVWRGEQVRFIRALSPWLVGVAGTDLALAERMASRFGLSMAHKGNRHRLIDSPSGPDPSTP